MRIDRPTFGKRRIVFQTDTPFKKYFLAYEGARTEVQYFDGVRDNRNYLEISQDIVLIPLLRNQVNFSLSHPNRVIEIVQKCLKDLNSNSRNLKSLVNSIADYCFENSDKLNTHRDKVALYSVILAVFTEYKQLNENDSINYNEKELTDIIQIVIEKLGDRLIYVKNISNFVLSQFETFDPDFDQVCIIIDRDKGSFKPYQYDKILEICKHKNYKIYISNPCFEFWLLMHFRQVFDIDFVKLKENPKIEFSSDNGIEKFNYTEIKLREILPDFNKSNVCFDVLKSNIPSAVLNSKKFELNLNKLKNNIGSNVGELIEELQGKNL